MKEPLTVSVFGATIPIPRWAIHLFGVIAVVGLGLYVYQRAFPSEPELVTQKQANAQMQREMDEYGLHLMEEPALATAMPDSTLAVKVYHDGCVAVQRKVGARVLTKLVVDLARGGPAQEASWLDTVFPVVSAQGRCINPHPGRFAQRPGQKNGCYVEVWRDFEDGCRHSQWMNACNGTWDTNPDGSPRVRWTDCRH